MSSSDVQRKLAAILVADVVGYSRLMGEKDGYNLDSTSKIVVSST